MTADETPVPAVDMWAPILPTPEMIAHASQNFPDEMLGYLRVFWKQDPSAELVREIMPSFERSEEEVIELLDEAAITRALITGFDEGGTCGKVFSANEPVAALAGAYPDRFIPFAGVDVTKGDEAVQELDRLVRDRGFVGLSLRPFMTRVLASDEMNFGLYEKCVEHDIPVSIHTSANWTTGAVNDFGHPRHIDLVATEFPDLKIIMSHAGYPWVLEACLLAWKHPNVYLELAAHRPKYFAVSGTGWEPLMRFGQTTIQDKVLYGSGTFLMGKSPAELLAEFRELPIKPEVMKKWLHGNAEQLLKLPVAA